MKNLFRLLSVLAVTSVLIGGTISCKASTASILDENAVRAYADPATETTLQGLSENNLAKYTQYGNAGFKAALTQETLDKAYSQINGQLGVYESKQFLRVEEQQGFILVHYKAKFAKGEAGVRMVFDSSHLVSGQWFE